MQTKITVVIVIVVVDVRSVCFHLPSVCTGISQGVAISSFSLTVVGWRLSRDLPMSVCS